MKNYTILILLLWTTLIVSGQNVTLNADGMSLDNVLISGNWFLVDLKSVLGEPAKYHRKAHTHTYDAHGILVYEGFVKNKSNAKLQEVQFYFTKFENHEYTPIDVFSGRFMINGTTINKDTGSDELLPLLTDWQKKISHIPHNYRYANESLYMYFLFNETESELLKISIGPMQ